MFDTQLFNNYSIYINKIEVICKTIKMANDRKS